MAIYDSLKMVNKYGRNISAFLITNKKEYYATFWLLVFVNIIQLDGKCTIQKIIDYIYVFTQSIGH